MVFSTLLFFSVGVLFVGLSVPFIRRRIKPNSLYGLRVRATFADERVWYEANAKSGRDLLLLGVGIGLVALGLPLVSGMTTGLQVTILVAVTSIGVATTSVIGISRANRLLRSREVGADHRERSA